MRKVRKEGSMARIVSELWGGKDASASVCWRDAGLRLQRSEKTVYQYLRCDKIRAQLNFYLWWHVKIRCGKVVIAEVACKIQSDLDETIGLGPVPSSKWQAQQQGCHWVGGQLRCWKGWCRSLVIALLSWSQQPGIQKDSTDERQSYFEQEETFFPQKSRGSSWIYFSGHTYKRSMLWM